jgi:hypothetical protein
MLNQVLEATLVVMILLLVLAVSVIVRIRPTTGSSTETRADSESAGLAAASTDVPASALWPGPLMGGITATAPPTSKTDRFIQRRYEARHVRGQVPRQRPPGPAGPPWEPAVPPPGRPQPGSERLI